MIRPPRPRTVSIGGATYDLFVRTDRRLLKESEDGEMLSLPVGAKIHVEQVVETCGGGASNSSVGLARLGCTAGFSGIIGSDQWGEKLLLNMQKEGVDTASATVVEGETSSFSIILSVSSGERIILYEPGTNAHLHRVTFDRERVNESDWLYLNHLQEDSSPIQDDLIAILDRAGKKLGLTWNPGGFHVEAGMRFPVNAHLLQHTSLLLLNKEEALAFARVQSSETALDVLLKAGAGIVCITDGGQGVLAGDGKTTYHCPVVKDAAIVDTTGAGDAFGVGATWAILSGLDLPTALRAGTINATSVLGTLGAQAGLLTDTEMQKRLSDTRLDVQVIRQQS